MAEPKVAAGIGGTTDPDKSCNYCKDTGHEKTNCLRLQKHNAFVASKKGRVKLEAPYLQGQGRRAAVDLLTSPIPTSKYKDLV